MGGGEDVRDSPCHRCDERQLYCHMTCQRYADFREAVRRDREAAQDQMDGYTCQSYCRMRARRATIPIRSKEDV